MRKKKTKSVLAITDECGLNIIHSRIGSTWQVLGEAGNWLNKRIKVGTKIRITTYRPKGKCITLKLKRDRSEMIGLKIKGIDFCITGLKKYFVKTPKVLYFKKIKNK